MIQGFLARKVTINLVALPNSGPCGCLDVLIEVVGLRERWSEDCPCTWISLFLFSCMFPVSGKISGGRVIVEIAEI
jgi:hypothetical protein